MAKDKKPKTEDRNLMCRLTDDEQRARGVELANAHKKLEELDLDKKRVQDDIKQAEANRDRLAVIVRNKQEERPVTCTMEPDYAADSMTIRRTDNGEIVEIRQLTFGERQHELPFDDEKKDDRPGVTAKVTAPVCACGHSMAEHVNGADECLEDGCDCKGFCAVPKDGAPLFGATGTGKPNGKKGGRK